MYHTARLGTRYNLNDVSSQPSAGLWLENDDDGQRAQAARVDPPPCAASSPRVLLARATSLGGAA